MQRLQNQTQKISSLSAHQIPVRSAGNLSPVSAAADARIRPMPPISSSGHPCTDRRSPWIPTGFPYSVIQTMSCPDSCAASIDCRCRPPNMQACFSCRYLLYHDLFSYSFGLHNRHCHAIPPRIIPLLLFRAYTNIMILCIQ